MFRQPIVGDKIEYINPNKPSDGYNVKNGKKKLNVGMYFYKSRKIEKRLKHSELKLTNIRFKISN
jgi:hypothetical protein